MRTVAENAANLNLNEEVVFGNSRITVVHQDMFDYTEYTMPTYHDYDLVYSAAGYDAMDDYGMRLSLMLMVIASATATGLLMMYKSICGADANIPCHVLKEPKMISR